MGSCGSIVDLAGKVRALDRASDEIVLRNEKKQQSHVTRNCFRWTKNHHPKIGVCGLRLTGGSLLIPRVFSQIVVDAAEFRATPL